MIIMVYISGWNEKMKKLEISANKSDAFDVIPPKVFKKEMGVFK